MGSSIHTSQRFISFGRRVKLRQKSPRNPPALQSFCLSLGSQEFQTSIRAILLWPSVYGTFKFRRQRYRKAEGWLGFSMSLLTMFTGAPRFRQSDENAGNLLLSRATLYEPQRSEGFGFHELTHCRPMGNGLGRGQSRAFGGSECLFEQHLIDIDTHFHH